MTGGSGAIGKAIAKALVLQGARVILVARSLKNLEETKATLPHPENVACLTCDVTNEESVVDVFKQIQVNYGACHLLINNAGTTSTTPTTELPVADFERVMQVNVLGPFLCAREALKQMRDSAEGGRIINIGSISAKAPRPESAPYTASKFALQGLTQSLALDARPHNVGVGIIHPGNVRSNLLSADEIARREALEGFIEPEDVATCVMTMAQLPPSANVLELTVMPTRQPLVGRG